MSTSTCYATPSKCVSPRGPTQCWMAFLVSARILPNVDHDQKRKGVYCGCGDNSLRALVGRWAKRACALSASLFKGTPSTFWAEGLSLEMVLRIFCDGFLLVWLGATRPAWSQLASLTNPNFLFAACPGARRCMKHHGLEIA